MICKPRRPDPTKRPPNRAAELAPAGRAPDPLVVPRLGEVPGGGVLARRRALAASPVSREGEPLSSTLRLAAHTLALPSGPERQATMNTLPLDHRVQIINALVEGNSIRSTERLFGHHRDTVMRLGLHVGESCAQLHDQLVREVPATTIQVDEIWSYVHTKKERVTPDDPPEHGDAWTYVALDADTRLVITYLVGARSQQNATDCMRDLRCRVVGRPQITTDGFKPYVGAIDDAFGDRVHYAMLTRTRDETEA